MSLSFLTPSRTVLFVSDEYLFIFTSGSSGVRLVDSLPWDAENFEASVAAIIDKECKKKPILIINDMVEQHYRKQKVMRAGVSIFEKSALIQRKLNITFPDYPIRAAYPLKEKVPKVAGQPPADVYIFAAVPGADQVNAAISVTRNSLASISGFCLLPVEAAGMVDALSSKLGAQKGKKKNIWSVFIGQHRNGNLRQVLTKNGELALTRTSPVTSKQDDPERWAREVYQEFQATLGYLSRFGYDREQGLNVFVVAGSAAGEALKTIFDGDEDLHVLGVSEAAKALGVWLGAQPEESYADVLHVGWIARKPRLAMPVKTTKIDEVSRPRQTAVAVSSLLLLSAAFLGYQGVSTAGKLSHHHEETDTAKQNLTQLDSQYQREVQRLESVGFDVRLVQSSLAVFDEFESERVQILDLFQKVGRTLGRDLRIDDIELKRPENAPVANLWGAVSAPQSKTVFEVRLKMTYPSTADVDVGNREVDELRGRIAQLLPEYEVEVTKFLKDYEYTEGLVVQTGDLDTEDIKQDFVAEITVLKKVEVEAEG